MTLLTPLGLLGLLGLVGWLIIYLIKPNYQQKLISTTYIWKLSLKYRKKRLPVSKLRNLLLILCQIFILTLCAGILARPNQVIKAETYNKEVVVIIDGSASMWATDENGVTRFEKAVKQAKDRIDNTFSEDGLVSIILSEGKSQVLYSRVNQEMKRTIQTTLNNLLEDPDTGNINCSFGTSDLEGALSLSEEFLAENPLAQLYVYTDTTYEVVPEGVHVVNVGQLDDKPDNAWNAAILNAYTEYEDNYYSFIVDVACFGSDKEIEITLVVQEPNLIDPQAPSEFEYTKKVKCSGDQTKRVIFLNADAYQETENESDRYDYYLIPNEQRVFTYTSISISLDVTDDSLRDDNNYFLYNGTKPSLNILYASGLPMPFFNGLLGVLRNRYGDIWSVEVTEYKVQEDHKVPTDGYDVYIYEDAYLRDNRNIYPFPSAIPNKLPTDGVVFLVNPLSAPKDAGFSVGEVMQLNVTTSLLEHEGHLILNNVAADNIVVNEYVELSNGGDYQELWHVDGDNPAFLVKDTPEAKVGIFAFSSRFSNVTLVEDFPSLWLNMFFHFVPPTIEKSSFEVDEQIAIKARGLSVEVSKDDKILDTFITFPSSIVVTLPGTYVLKQELLSGDILIEQVFVKIPAKESNIVKVEEKLPEIDRPDAEKDTYIDWLVYLAGAMVALLFVEWWLQSRENM